VPAARADARSDPAPGILTSRTSAASTELAPALSPFRAAGLGPHACFMSLRMVAFDLLAVLVLLSLISIVLLVVFGAAIGLLTVARAKRQLRRGAGHLDKLPGFSGSKDLIEIDASLDRIMTEECGALPRCLPG
jgi:hypothetical protein